MNKPQAIKNEVVIQDVGLRNVTKVFPGGVVAAENISIASKGGEIHAVLGENGAGKTTLMSVLAGVHKPTTGIVEIDGKPCVFRTPRDAKLRGIGMVHQHFSLVPALTVAENLALGRSNCPFLYNPRRWSRHIQEEAQQRGLEIRPDAPVWKLSIGEQQRVEVFRLILEGSRVLILDEPTSILSPQEADVLFEHIVRFAKAGHVIFLVTHKIHHVQAIAHKVSVLRRGRLLTSGLSREFAEGELAELMVGRHFVTNRCIRRQPVPPNVGEVPLKVRSVSVHPLSCRHGLNNVSFDVSRGEVFGVAGISGNGQDELVGALVGMTAFSGQITVCSETCLTRARRTIAYIPGDRRREGLAMPLSLEDNLVLRAFGRRPFSFLGFLNRKAIRAFARQKIAEYDINPGNHSWPVRTLSGGNMQKAILARELDGKPQLIIAVNPTAGLDLATTHLVHSKLVEHAAHGTAVLLISDDLDELLHLCHRIIVLQKGEVRLSGQVDSLTRMAIGIAMTTLNTVNKRESASSESLARQPNELRARSET